jgi:hypothetical protein
LGADEDRENQGTSRSKLCAGWELRITERCLVDDLGLAPDASYADALARHKIVDAFSKKRSERTDNGKTVGPAAGDNTLYRLGHGHRHRGATWYDQDGQVVWLCAYGRHESGADDDAFPYFDELMRTGTMMPTTADRDAAAEDRAARLAAALPRTAQQLLEEARANPGTEVRGTVGSTAIGVVVVVVEKLEETHVAIVGATGRKEIYAILAAFFADAEFGEWSPASNLPARDLDWEAFESGWYILHGCA